MFYRVVAFLTFTNPDEARDFLHDCIVALPKTAIINPGLENEEKPFAILHKCFHDLEPTKPCEILETHYKP